MIQDESSLRAVLDYHSFGTGLSLECLSKLLKGLVSAHECGCLMSIDHYSQSLGSGTVACEWSG